MHASQRTQKCNTKPHGGLKTHGTGTQTGGNANATFSHIIIFQPIPLKYPETMSQHHKSHVLGDRSFEE